MLGLDVYNGSKTQLENFGSRATVTFPLLLSASGTGFSREDLVVVGPDGTVAFRSRSLSSSTVRSNATNKVNELLKQKISVQETAVNFGTVEVDQNVKKTFTVENTGLSSLSVTGITSNVSGLTFDTTTFTLESGGSKTVTATFSSSTAGTFSGTISISSNDPNSATSTVSVSITVQPPPVQPPPVQPPPVQPPPVQPPPVQPPPAPAISVQQTAVDFGTVAFAQSVQQTITITNTGNASLNVTGITSDVSGLTFDTTMFTLAPNGSQTVTVTFPSSMEGTFSGNINILSNDPEQATQTLSVSIIVKVPSANSRADFNGDKVVNIADFLLFVEAFGSTNSQFDINGDGVVGVTDFLLFVESFGKTVDG